jgi:hypothetical protein
VHFVFGFVVFALLQTVGLEGQTGSDSQPFISTDRPSVASSPVVVSRGDFQVENGLLLTSAQDHHIIDFPETALRFGLLKKTELRFATPTYFDELSGGTVSASGFGDIAIGVKQQLGPIGRNLNLSLVLFLSLPTGAKALSSHGYDPGLQVPWSLTLSPKWTVGGQIATYWPTQEGTHNLTGEATLLVDHQLTKPWDAFIEYVGDFPQRGGSRQLLHFGSAYKIAPRHQIDFQLAVGLSDAAPDVFIGVGYSFLLRVRK